MTFLIPLSLCLLILFSVVQQDSTAKLAENRQALLAGEVVVQLFDLEDDVMGVRGDIFVAGSAQRLWEVLVDYDNLARFLPTMLYSKVSHHDSVKKVVDQILHVKIAFFKKKVSTKLEITEDYLQRVQWQAIGGDFQVYNGSWTLMYDNEASGTFLTYRAEIKPGFFAPKSLGRRIQKRDIPQTLRAIERRVLRMAAPASSPR